MSGLTPEFNANISDNDASAGAHARITWSGLAAYLALLAGGVGVFFLVRAFGEGLSATPAPADASTVGRSQGGVATRCYPLHVPGRFRTQRHAHGASSPRRGGGVPRQHRRAVRARIGLSARPLPGFLP